jgi:hypothetical protein
MGLTPSRLYEETNKDHVCECKAILLYNKAITATCNIYFYFPQDYFADGYLAPSLSVRLRELSIFIHTSFSSGFLSMCIFIPKHN